MRNRNWIGLSALVGCLVVSGTTQAQDQPPVKMEHPLVSSLKDVITQGATLFNEKNDHAGCYRVYQGALIAVRPYLIDNPKLLAKVDQSLKSVESLPKMSDRAFALRAVLDGIRDSYKNVPYTPGPGPGPAKKPIETIPDPKKVENPPEIKKDEIKKDPPLLPPQNKQSTSSVLRLEAALAVLESGKPFVILERLRREAVIS